MEEGEQQKLDTDEAKKPSEEEKEEPETKDKVTRAEEAVKRMDENIAKFEKLVERNEKASSDSILSGTSGEHIEAKSIEEETPKEHRKRIEKELTEGKYNDQG